MIKNPDFIASMTTWWQKRVVKLMMKNFDLLMTSLNRDVLKASLTMRYKKIHQKIPTIRSKNEFFKIDAFDSLIGKFFKIQIIFKRSCCLAIENFKKSTRSLWAGKNVQVCDVKVGCFQTNESIVVGIETTCSLKEVSFPTLSQTLRNFCFWNQWSGTKNQWSGTNA